MKRLFLLLTTALFLASTLSSCNDCRGIDCENGGTCNEGECDCLRGYEGENCEIKDICVLNDVECNFGECDEGVCFCLDGYELEDCSREAREKFIGRYFVTEGVEDLDTVLIDIRFEKDPLNVPEMYIVNLFNYEQFPVTGFFSRIKAEANPNTKGFRIPRQAPDGTEKEIQGSGSITSAPDDSSFVEINISYTVFTNNKEYQGEVKGNLVE